MQLVLPATLPSGLLWRPELLGRDEEAELVGQLAALPFSEVRMHGIAAKRRTAHFGYGYAFASARLEHAPPLPDFLRPLRARAAALAGLPPDRLAEALVTEYPPGSGIGWHKDAPVFGDTVVGVSLGSASVLRLRRGSAGRAEIELPLPPRSAYVLSGVARYAWQHHLPKVRALRYSITFRTLAAEPPRV